MGASIFCQCPEVAGRRLCKSMLQKRCLEAKKSLIFSKGSFGCNLEASDSVQNRVDLELQSDSEATVRLNSSST